MENEDDILNIEFDPNELEDIDEDAVLGSSTDGPNLARQSSATTSPIESDGPSNAQPANDEENPDVVESGDEDEEDEGDKDRSKFHSERQNNASASNQRLGAARTAIPDSLDKVKINQKDAQFSKPDNFRKRRADGRPPNRFASPEPKRVLLNPHFRGTVPVNPQIRLAWDLRAPPQQPMRFGPVNVRPVISIPPSIVQRPFQMPLRAPNRAPVVNLMNSSPMGNLVNPAHAVRPISMPSVFNTRPSMPPVSATNISAAMCRYPPAPPQSAWSGEPLRIPGPAMYARGPPMSAPPPTRASPSFVGAPRILPSPPNSIYAALPRGVPRMFVPSAPKPLNIAPSSNKPTSSDDWFNMTEDFLRQNRLGPSGPARRTVVNEVQAPPKSVVSRQRQAAADVKRKYLAQNDRQKKPLSNRPSIEHEAVLPSEAKNGRSTVECVDADYLRKIEEQKRQREAVLRRKEQGRLLKAKTRQDDQLQTPVESNASIAVVSAGFLPKARAELSLATSNQVFGRRRV